jgi:hypothetical protein
MVFKLTDYDDDEEQQFTPTTNFAQDFTQAKAIELGLDPEIALNMIGAESGWNPNAVSPKGATGYAQLMPGTAGDLGVDIDNPLQNISGGVEYLDKQIDRFGPEKGVAAYNFGPGNIARGTPLPEETKNYVPKVLGRPLSTVPSFEPQATPPPTSSRRLSDLAQAQAEIGGLEALKSGALGELGKGSNLEGSDALAMALTALLPTLIGWGAGGMQGGAMGAQAGAAGAGLGLSGFAAEAKERENANKTIYSDAATQLAAKRGELKGIKDSIADREEQGVRDIYLEGNKFARSNQMARAIGKGAESPFGEQQQAKIQEYRAAAQSGVAALTAINNKFADKLGQRYLTEDGELDWAGIKQSGTALLEGALGAGTETDKFNSEMKTYISQLVKATSGTAASDKEQEYLTGIVQGSGLLPADVPTVYQNIASLVAKQQAQAQSYMQTAIAARAENPMGAVMDTFPKIQKMNQSRPSETQAPTIPSGARSITFADGSKGYHLNGVPYNLKGEALGQ